MRGRVGMSSTATGHSDDRSERIRPSEFLCQPAVVRDVVEAAQGGAGDILGVDGVGGGGHGPERDAGAALEPRMTDARARSPTHEGVTTRELAPHDVEEFVTAEV